MAEDTLDGSLWTTEHITASANVTSELLSKISLLPRKPKEEKLLIKAVQVAKNNLLPYLYYVMLFLKEVAHYFMNCLVKAFSQMCLICGQSNCLHMAVLK